MAVLNLNLPAATGGESPVKFKADLIGDMQALETSNNDIETRQLVVDEAADVVNSVSAQVTANAAQVAADAAQVASDKIAADAARALAETAQANAVAVVTGGVATIAPAAGKIPLARADGSIDPAWLGVAFQPTYKTNWIGLAGTMGFGVGICPSTLPAGMSEMGGTRDISSDEYGNYIYSDSSIMIWVPAFYYKWGTGANGLALNTVDVKAFGDYTSVATANAAGYALHRAFYDGGAVQSGVFVDKYQCSNSGGIASSVRFANPLSTNAAHNPISALNNAPANNYGGAILAPKSRGVAFFCNTRFIFSALAMLSYAHGQTATTATWCAWYDAAGITNYPKGNNNNALGDANDAAISYITDGYLNAGQCGSANLFSRTAHNGQNCGVADLNGNMWEINPGLTSDATNYYILNTATKMRDVTGGNTLATDLFGAVGIAALYTSLGATYGQLWAVGANRTVGFGSPTIQTLSDATAGNAWNAAGAGVPLAGGGANAFGNDLIWDYKPNELCPIASGYWRNAANAGVWALGLYAVRGSSGYGVGFRSALYL